MLNHPNPHLSTFPHGPYEGTITIGPATVIASVNTLSAGIAFVKLTYACPFSPCGTVHAPFSYFTNALPPAFTPPFVNAHAVVPGAVVCKLIL
jgi:hypothetical protein